MRQFVLLFAVCFLFGLKMNAQDDFAVIRDDDGFVNIRESTLQSKIIGKISKYQIFDCYTDPEEKDIRVDYPNMINIRCPKYANENGESYQRNTGSAERGTTGYLHKSRVYKLSQMPKLKLKTMSDSKVLFANDSIQITFETAKFNPSKHQLKDSKGRQITITNLDVMYEKELSYVDGKRIWGFIDKYHSKEITSITVNYNNKNYSLPTSSFKNIFAPNFENNNTKVCIGLDGELYVWMQNGDGGESYNVIWVIVDGKLKCMYLYTSYYV
jgi:hypothetical protein